MAFIPQFRPSYNALYDQRCDLLEEVSEVIYQFFRLATFRMRTFSLYVHSREARVIIILPNSLQNPYHTYS